MKVLIISHSYAPSLTPRAFRWSTIAEYWSTQGHHVDVLCASGPELAREAPKTGPRIYRAFDIFNILRNSAGRGNPRNASAVPDTANPAPTLRSRLFTGSWRWLYSKIWKQVYWPDYACLWFVPAFREARRLMARERYDAVITVSYPFIAHVVGLMLAKNRRPWTWIADIGDPFCFLNPNPLNNERLYHKLNYLVEWMLFRKADVVSVTTEGTLRKYAEIFLNSASKIHVIGPLLSVTNSPSPLNGGSPDDGKLRLVFVGTLDRDIRAPDFLLRLYACLLKTHLSDRLELHFVGDVANCAEAFDPYRALNGHNLFLHGVLPRESALRMTSEADVLVNIGNETPYQLPSKVVEYASSGKPVLNVCTISNDSSAAFFTGYPPGLSVVREPDGECSDAQIRRVVQFLEHPVQIPEADLQTFVRQFRIGPIAEAYERLLCR